MKLCAIYNVWDDYDLLELSVNNILPLVEGVIIIYSETSNYGEKSRFIESFENCKIYYYNREPKHTTPMESETDKRNYGLGIAKELGYTHFITIDADEFYHSEDVLIGKKMFEEEPDLKGIVVSSQVYFRSPTLTIGLDTTRVPFVHKIDNGLRHEFNRKYPFAWEGIRDIRIDPTRSLNINDGVKFLPEIVMHHYSWVREDYEKKIRNSTARSHIEKSTIREDLRVAKSGELCKFYNKVLRTAPNYFNIPEYDVMV